MKESFIQIIPIIIFSLIIFYSRQASASIIMLDSQTGRFGEEVTFTVKIGPSSAGVEAFGFDIKFDSSILKYIGFSRKEITNKLDLFNVHSPSYNLLRIGGLSINPLKLDNSVELVQLKFTCLSNSAGESSLNISRMVDDFSEWRIQNGTFTCLKDTKTSGTNMKQLDKQRKINDPNYLKDYGTRFSPGGIFDPDQLFLQENEKKTGKPVYSNRETGVSQNTEKKSGITIISKETDTGTSDEDHKPALKMKASDAPEEEVFDATGLRTGLISRYGAIPAIKATFPEDGAQEIPADTISSIKIIFNQPMDNLSVEKAFVIKPHVDGRFKWLNSLTEMEFIPGFPISPGMTYLIYLSDKATDIYGRNMDGDLDSEMGGEFSFTFKTKEKFEGIPPEPEPLSVSQRIRHCFITTLLHDPSSNI